MPRNHNDFHENLEFAQRGEEEVALALSSKLRDFEIVAYNNDNKFDIVGTFRGKEVTFEVKEDVRVADTGNVVIEYSSRGKRSGILTSIADFWIFRLHLDGGVVNYMFKVKEIRRAIDEGAYKFKRRMTHTDSCNGLYFFDVEELIKYSCMKF